jgi:hypothetical protein
MISGVSGRSSGISNSTLLACWRLQQADLPRDNQPGVSTGSRSVTAGPSSAMDVSLIAPGHG